MDGDPFHDRLYFSVADQQVGGTNLLSAEHSLMQNLVKAFTIFAKYTDSEYDLGAEHEQIWVYVNKEKLPEDSEDGKVLKVLGWFIDENDVWSKFV